MLAALFSKDLEYKEVAEHDSESETLEHERSRVTRRAKRSTIAIWILSSIVVLLLVALVQLLHRVYHLQQGIIPRFSYSPAQDVVEYKPVVFTDGFKSKSPTPYQGEPNDEKDALWEDLYNVVGSSRIDRSSAARLANKTVRIPGDPGMYIVGLDIFHQLHCLNFLRKYVYNDYYHIIAETMTEEERSAQRVHLDSIRQSLMCSADISTIPFQWREDIQKSEPVAGVLHTCRNFDKIYEWAVANQLVGDFDLYTHVKNDLEEKAA